ATLCAPMSFQARIDQDLKEAMKAREAERLGVLRMLKAALKNAAIEKGGMQFELTDQDALAIVRKEMKKRQDSIESFTKGGRPELAAKEQSEAEILTAYLPQAMTPEEVQSLVAGAIADAGATSKKEMGAVMKLANERAAGRVDGRTLSAAVSAALP
ncbi:MAG: GatB/YqeY domain-containing protein, partial [Chthoniobacteraceae bacterium]